MGNAIRILAADDDPMVKFVWNNILADSPYKITFVENGLKVINSNIDEIDIMFLDINMPDLNGIEVTKIIKEKYQDIPIVGVTANVSDDVLTASKAAGMNEILKKPLLIDDLNLAVSKWVQRT